MALLCPSQARKLAAAVSATRSCLCRGLVRVQRGAFPAARALASGLATVARARRPRWQQTRGIPPTHAALGFIALLVVLAVPLALAQDASAQTPADKAPTNLAVTPTNGAVTLGWSAPTQDAASVTGYRELRRLPDDDEYGTAERMAAVVGHGAFLTALGQETDAVKPALADADPPLANGLTLALTYDEPLDATSEPAPSDFEVLVNSTARTVSTVAVSDSAVTLTLESSLTVGQTVTVSYTPGSNPIRDDARNQADALTNQSVTNETKTNILLITADDLNWDSVGVYGSPVTGSTPNIDRLATEGIRFNHAHVTIAVCTPNRSVLMSGRYPHLSGGEGFHRLSLDGVPILPALLRTEGYTVGILDKVQHSTPYEDFSWDTALETELGFGRNPEAFYQHAKTFVEGASDGGRPFFLMANSRDPHRPFYGNDPDSYYSAAVPAVAPSDTFTSDDIVVPGFLPDLTDVRTEVAEYYSSVRRLDDTVGRLLDVLDDTGVAENTIVMFLSDHGMSFPFAKANVYFNSTRTPWIVRWPGVIQSGSVDTEHFISSIDLLPTILDAIGADIPAGVNGKTFLPLLRGEEQDDRDQVFTQFHETFARSALPMRSVQNAQFGYIYSHWSDGIKEYGSESQKGRTWDAMKAEAAGDEDLAARTRLYSYRVPEELYDYQSDPNALENLIDDADYADDLESLRTGLEEWMVETNDPLLSGFHAFTAGLTTHDICDRTQEVEDALLAAVAATDCALVPGSQLAAVTTLDLSAESISALEAGDFAGLTGLTTLDLADNALTTLPGGVFNPLTSLTALALRGNAGLAYSPYLLSVLTSLSTLDGATYTRPAVAAAPTSLTGAFVGGNIELGWTAPETGAPTSYQVLRTAGSGDEEVYVEDTYDPDASPPSTTYLDTGVTEGETYAYRVRALNAGGASLASDSATVPAALVLSGPSDVSHPEESALRVVTFTAGPARPSLVWSLTGDDGGDFTIAGGVLRFAPAPTPMADYESPADADGDNEYSVTVQAAEAGATSVTMQVTVTVTDVDDAGTLTLSSTRPRLGEALTAKLDDPDGVVDGTPVYTWERSLRPNAWAGIAGATSSAYTPVAADADTFLRAAVSYEDGHGAGKTAGTVAYVVVTASQLTALQVTTGDATATPARALRPAFSPDVLHYAVGCTNNDTMTVTPTAATGVRLAVNGVQVASGTGRTVTVGGESDVHVTLTTADGAITTYVVHCLVGSLWILEAHKTPGAAGILEELILLTLPHRTLLMLDNNGVPRFHRELSYNTWAYFRVERVVGADQQQGHEPEYRYSYAQAREQGRHRFSVLDQDLERIDRDVHTVAPLETTDLHDFRVLENGNYLLLAYEPAERDLSDLPFTHPDVEATQPQTVLDSAIQIITPEGQAVFTWNSWGIMPLEDCTQHRFVKFRGGPGGYAHINSLQMVDGLIIASFRGCSQVLAIDPDHAEDHKVAWRVGRTNLSAEEWAARDIGPAPLAVVGDPAGEFCAQHAAQVLPNGNLLLFDNGVHCVVDPWTGAFVGRTDENYYSRGVEYALDHANGEAVFVRGHSLHSARQYLGNAHGQIEPLANGDWLISWGRARGNAPAEEIPDVAITQVDPDTGEEKFSFRVPNPAAMHYRAIPLHPVALFTDPGPLAAALPDSSSTSVFHLGTTDAPQVVVAFSRPVVDFAADTPSLSVQGATVASVSPHLVAGEPANAYLVTLTPDGDGAITFNLVADQACSAGGICAADGAMLTKVPAPLVVGAPVTVEFAQAAYAVDEGGTVDVTVSLSAAHQGVREVKVPLTVADSATMTHDYLVSVESVSFAAGERTKTVTVSAQPDQDDNDDEYVTLGFGALPDGVSAGATSETRVSVTDDDDPEVTVSFGSPTLSVAEGGGVRVALTLDVNPERTIAIPITVTNQAGASGGDYGGVPSTVTFNSGETAKAFTLTAAQDSVDDDDEGLTLGFGMLPARVRAGSPDATTVAIADDDVPAVTVRFEQDTYTVAENSDVTVRVLLSAVPERVVTIPLITTDLGGATGSDYRGVPGSVTFTHSETVATFTVTAVEDSVDDDGESVRLALGGLPDGVRAAARRQATISITDDDLPAVSVRFGTASYEVEEGGDVTITLTLNTAPERTITIPITAVPLGGASETDYALTASALTFSSDQTERTFTLSATDDREDDNGESVLLTLGTLPTGVGEDPSLFQTSVAIIDDDVTVRFQAAGYTVAEGADVTVSVTLSEDPRRTVVIPITAAGRNGAAGVDYAGVPAQLTYQRGQTVKSFTLAATDDTVDDDDESVELGFGTLPDTVLPAGHVTASVSIIDDDLPEVAVGFEQSSYAVAEGRSVTVRVRLSAEPERPVAVQLTAAEQAGATSADYSGVPASVTFTPEATEQTFTFTASTDDTYDDKESVLIGLGALPERVRAGAVAETTVVITDDDLPQVAVSFDVRSSTVTEGGRVTIGLSLSDDPKRTVTIPITVTNQGGATESDHTGVPPRVTFGAGETAKTFTVLATRDADEDGGEWVVLGFDALPEGVSRGAIEAVTVTIRDGARASGGSVGGGGGGFGPAPVAPKFADGFRTTRTLAQNARAEDAVGDPVSATHPDELAITYALSGADAARFTVDAETGQIRVKDAVAFKLGQTFTVNLTATDSAGFGAIIIVVIEVGESLHHRYDLNGNGVIEKSEVLAAIADYFAGRIEKPLVLEVVSLYFAA